MALLLIEGFDYYGSGDLSARGWVGNLSFSTSSGRRGGGCLTGPGSNYQSYRPLGATYTALVAGCAFYVPASAAACEIMGLYDTGGAQLTVVWSGAGTQRIDVYRGGTLIGSSANNVVLTGSGWHYLEIKATIASGTGGSYDVRVDGVSVVSATGVNTLYTGTGVTRLGLGCITTSATGQSNFRWDDIYVCDQTGGPPLNTFLGDCRVDVCVPTGAGSNSDFSSSGGGGSSYANVDENPPNTTDYNYSSTVNAVDTYAMGDLAALGATIYGVQVHAYMAKSDSGSRSAAPVVKSGATTSVGTAVALGTSYVYASQLFATDPATGAAWTESGVNAMEAGVKVTA